MTKDKVLYVGAMTTIAMAIFLMGLFIYQMVWPFKPVTFLEQITVTPKTVQAGDDILLGMHFEKHMQISPEIEYFLINGESVLLEGSGVTRPTGEQAIEVIKHLPGDVTPGEYHVQMKLTYPINAIREVVVIEESETFIIVGGDE